MPNKHTALRLRVRGTRQWTLTPMNLTGHNGGGSATEHDGTGDGDGGRKVLVGVKLDPPSRELLTWALVKVAEPGDVVIALHSIHTENAASRLSLVKAFDSVMAAYEGFCNLKQVDLKLKVCRGASPRKTVVQEAESLGVDTVIVGTSHSFHGIRSSASVAKYCAKKLPKCISIFAVNNGKVAFHREATRMSSDQVHPDPKQSIDHNGDSSTDGESGAIVPFGSDIISPPHLSWDLSGIPEELLGLREKYSSSCKLYSIKELVSATANFSSENLVGTGGCSHVYRGCLPDGKELAVKILKSSEDVIKEFVQEIEIITTLHHKNIISLSGFCVVGNNLLLLVYDLLSRGSLEENLCGNKNDCSAFGWQERYKVAVGVAEALNYLHNGCAHPVIHRDVKSSNILLSDDFEPQLSDFGLASWGSSSSHSSCTDVAGTFGYLAPEYFMHGRVTEKIDVYAFGVVLLELLSSKKPINNECPEGQQSLVMWATPILKEGKLSQLLDPGLGSDYSHFHIQRMVLAATLCIRRSSRLRPHIRLILNLLQGDVEVMRWAAQEVNASEEPVSTNIQSHLNLALLDVEDDTDSISSTEQIISTEDYLRERCSRTSSFA